LGCLPMDLINPITIATKMVRGLRGAITVAENTRAEILKATAELLERLIAQNQISIPEIASILFSTTADLNAEFPAAAARELGLEDTPLLCMTEIPVPGSLPLCIRILVHVNTEKSQKEMKPVYLKDAIKLRPDQIK
jgi:chorismate mutase